jgi:hypothetical protein
LERESQGKTTQKRSTAGKPRTRKNRHARNSAVRKKILYKVSSYEMDIDETALCNNDEADDTQNVERCVMCSDTGKDNEL